MEKEIREGLKELIDILKSNYTDNAKFQKELIMALREKTGNDNIDILCRGILSLKVEEKAVLLESLTKNQDSKEGISHTALKLDFNAYNVMLDETIESDTEYQHAFMEFKKALEPLREKNLLKEMIAIDDAVVSKEAAIQETIYKKAFQDGMSFILDTMNGKGVIEI